MPITTPLKPSLQEDIKKAFEKARDNGSGGADSDQIIKDLAKDITEGIDKYIMGMVVTVTVQPGQTVPIPPSPVVGGTVTTPMVSSTTTPGIGTT